jgi:hypothetical protein
VFYWRGRHAQPSGRVWWKDRKGGGTNKGKFEGKEIKSKKGKFEGKEIKSKKGKFEGKEIKSKKGKFEGKEIKSSIKGKEIKSSIKGKVDPRIIDPKIIGVRKKVRWAVEGREIEGTIPPNHPKGAVPTFGNLGKQSHQKRTVQKNYISTRVRRKRTIQKIYIWRRV